MLTMQDHPEKNNGKKTRKNQGRTVAKSSGDLSDWQRYKHHRNTCAMAFRKQKSRHFQQQEETLGKEVDGSFKWWKRAKRLAGVSTPKVSIPDLNADGHTVTELADKVLQSLR